MSFMIRSLGEGGIIHGTKRLVFVYSCNADVIVMGTINIARVSKGNIHSKIIAEGTVVVRQIELGEQGIGYSSVVVAWASRKINNEDDRADDKEEYHPIDDFLKARVKNKKIIHVFKKSF